MTPYHPCVQDPPARTRSSEDPAVARDGVPPLRNRPALRPVHLRLLVALLELLQEAQT